MSIPYEEARLQFADGYLGVSEVGEAELSLGASTISALAEAGVVGEAFQAYYNHVNRDAERVRAGLHDGSAREWVIGWHKERCRAWFDACNITATAGHVGEHDATGDVRENAFDAFERHFSAEAEAFHAELLAEPLDELLAEEPTTED